MTEPTLARALTEELRLPLEAPSTPPVSDFVQQCFAADVDPGVTLRRALDRVTPENVAEQ